MLRRHLLVLSSLLGSLCSLTLPGPAAIAQVEGSACGQTTGPTVIYDQPRGDADIIAQVIPPGRTLSLDPDFSQSGWVRVTNEAIFGFTLTQYLEECDAVATPPPPAEETDPPEEPAQAVVGSCAVALPDRSAQVLSVRPRAGAETAFNAIAAGQSIVLSSEQALYDPDQGRYWRQVLAYPPLQTTPSPTREAWISETGPNAPRLIESSGGVLVSRRGLAYGELNITRRPCETLFPNADIAEGQPLPRQLPDGYRRP